MKWLLALIALVALVSCAAAYTDAELVQRSLCTFDYQCQDGCRCETPKPTVPKMCFCYSHAHKATMLVCRRKEYL